MQISGRVTLVDERDVQTEDRRLHHERGVLFRHDNEHHATIGTELGAGETVALSQRVGARSPNAWTA